MLCLNSFFLVVLQRSSILFYFEVLHKVGCTGDGKTLEGCCVYFSRHFIESFCRSYNVLCDIVYIHTYSAYRHKIGLQWQYMGRVHY